MKYTPKHAADALEIMDRLLPQVTFREEYGQLISILREPTRWKEAHEQFSKIRVNITLPSEAHCLTSLNSYFVYVAENAAKTAYNCSGEPAPFDDDSYEWLLKCEKEFLEQATKRNRGFLNRLKQVASAKRASHDRSRSSRP